MTFASVLLRSVPVIMSPLMKDYVDQRACHECLIQFQSLALPFSQELYSSHIPQGSRDRYADYRNRGCKFAMPWANKPPDHEAYWNSMQSHCGYERYTEDITTWGKGDTFKDGV
jgi:hypothetical protein